ncbi:MAG: hypothetical protein FWD45_07310, partial [Coriobacteriia bacterium]|nr:hypothetical protein [Coriobacteriia bacterium]
NFIFLVNNYSFKLAFISFINLSKQSMYSLLFAGYLLFAGLLHIVITPRHYQQARKTASSYSLLEWDQTAQQYSSNATRGGSLYLDKDEKVVATPTYIISVRDYIDVVRFDEIIWIYRKMKALKRYEQYSVFTIITRNGRKIRIISGRAEDWEIVKGDEALIYRSVQANNHDVLVGYHGDEKKQARTLIKAFKNDSSYMR